VERTDYTSFGACALRVTVIDAAGTPVTGDDTVFVISGFTAVENSLVLSEGESFEVKDACGNICFSLEDCDKIKGTEGSITLCLLDAELIAATTGAPLLLNLEGDPIGFSLPDSNAGCPDGFALEVWSRAYDGNERATDDGDALFIRHVWPRLIARLGDTTIDFNPMSIPLSTKGTPNSLLAAQNGPAGDWPDGIVGAYAMFYDTTTVVPLSGPQPYPTVS
jgi:hypothetical protein